MAEPTLDDLCRHDLVPHCCLICLSEALAAAEVRVERLRAVLALCVPALDDAVTNLYSGSDTFRRCMRALNEAKAVLAATGEETP